MGSNIANILLVIGISAAAAPLFVAREVVRRDVPLMIFISLIVYVIALGGTVHNWQGWLLFAGAIGYTVYTVREGRRTHRAQKRADLEAAGIDPDTHQAPKLDWLHLGLQVLFLVGGLALLVLGANWLVSAAVTIATWLGVSPLVIGLTIVAVGTSLPEVATSVVATLRGERDLAVGNAVGSNLFNILLVLGLTSALTPGGLPISDAARTTHIPIMLFVAAICLPVFGLGQVITRWEGVLFLFLYIAYNVYLFLEAGSGAALGVYRLVMLAGVIPMLLVAWLIAAGLYLRRRQMRALEAAEETAERA